MLLLVTAVVLSVLSVLLLFSCREQPCFDGDGTSSRAPSCIVDNVSLGRMLELASELPHAPFYFRWRLF